MTNDKKYESTTKNRVYFFDTTLRDGEQVPGCQLNTIEKIEIAKTLEELGVDVIEAGFPISSPGDYNSVVEISKAVNHPIICALTRAIEKDIITAVEALKYAKHPRIHTGIGTSMYHIVSKFNSTPEKIIEQAVAAVKFAKKYVEDIEFYAEDAGRTENEYLARVVEAVIAAGATVVNIPDTTGYCLPDDYGKKIKFIVDNVKNIDKAIISTHCHNDLGMATANTISGVINGARQVEVTINGIGERAGNTSLEEIAMILKSHKECNLTSNIVTKKIYYISKMVSRLMSMPIQANKAIVGRNAFAHSSGIHQDGVLKNRENYEIVNPSDVGINESTITLTARSGRAALKHRLELLSYNFSKEELDKIYVDFLALADNKKSITDDDLLLLIGKEQENEHGIKLDFLQVVCGEKTVPMTTVRLYINGEPKIATCRGNGPLDASFTAIKEIIQKDVHLEEYLVQAITGGHDDLAKVHVQVKHNDKIYYGFSAGTDTITASVEAFINALNKITSLFEL